MESHFRAGMAAPKILNPDHSLQHTCRKFPSVWNNLCQATGLNKVFSRSAFFSEPLMKYWDHDEVRKIDVITGCFWMVRRECIAEVGLLDNDFFIYGEDIDWCRRFSRAGWDVMFYPGAEAVHFGGGSSDRAPVKFYLEMQKADLKYWRKHHGRSGKFMYWTIILMRQLLRMPVYALKYVFSSKQRKSALFKLKRSVVCVLWLLRIKKREGAVS